jgi:hypothetical protein
MTEKPTYEVGYKKPPLKRQFGRPEGNPNGKTATQKAMEMKNAEAATRIRSRFLSATETMLGESSTQQAMDLMNKDILRLLKDSEDRGLGSPKSAVDHTSSDGSMTPRAARELTDEELERIAASDDPSE